MTVTLAALAVAVICTSTYLVVALRRNATQRPPVWLLGLNLAATVVAIVLTALVATGVGA